MGLTVRGPISPPNLPVGVSDYAELRRAGYTYVDKTAWIVDALTGGAVALLVPRPRRFGKTLNLSALRYFVERVPDAQRAEREALFADTWIWTAHEEALRTHFARYPVIELSFKDVKEETWEACWEQVRAIIREEARRIWQAHDLAEHYVDADHVLREYAQLDADEASHTDIVRSLHNLSRWLRDATGERVVILVDEYDAPLNAAWQNGYLDEALPFFRGFLSGGFKDNRNLFKGVLTGVLRVAKEGIFSGLNNLTVASILSSDMADRFGFTEAEVAELAECVGATDRLSELREWYNGYRFGRAQLHTLYNPWSVLQYLRSLQDGPRSHWNNTSDNALIRDLVRRHAAAVGPQIEQLLRGDEISVVVEENVALQRLERSAQTVIDLLFFSGYLTATKNELVNDRLVSTLRIPNREVRLVFQDTFAHWMTEASSQGASGIELLISALLSGEADTVEEVLSELLVRMLSFHDVAGNRVEAVYQAFFLGLLVEMAATHRVVSNREAGYGRADVLFIPRKAGPGAVLELKRVLSKETPKTALDRAVEQLGERDYAAELRDAGATEIHQYGVVFDGKRCWVRAVE